MISLAAWRVRDELCKLVNDAPYCFTGYTTDQAERYAYVTDSTFYGTKEKPDICMP